MHRLVKRSPGGRRHEFFSFVTAVRQVPASNPCARRSGGNGVRVTQTMVDSIARIVEQQTTSGPVLPEMASEVRRRLPS